MDICTVFPKRAVFSLVVVVIKVFCAAGVGILTGLSSVFDLAITTAVDLVCDTCVSTSGWFLAAVAIWKYCANIYEGEEEALQVKFSVSLCSGKSCPLSKTINFFRAIAPSERKENFATPAHSQWSPKR